MRFKVRDRVVHIDYPNTRGTVVATRPSRGIVLVLWDQPQPMSVFGQVVATSQHIPSALRVA